MTLSWASYTATNTIVVHSVQLVYGKAMTSADELEPQTYWAISMRNFDLRPQKRISEKRTKNQAKTDKTEHGMEKRGKAKVKSKPKSTPTKSKPRTRLFLGIERDTPSINFDMDDLVSKFINQFFPPSKTTNLRNEITRFQQRFDESFYEAWDRFNDLLRACPHHGFSELHQLDTFYNALNANDQDSLNSAAGGNFLDKMPRECLKIIESKSKVRNSRNKAVVAKVSSNSSTPGISPDVAALTTEVSKLKNMMKTMLIEKQKAQAPAPVKAVEQSCVTCGGAHSYRNCPATDGNIYQDNIQEYVSQAAAANFIKGIQFLDTSMVANQSDLLITANYNHMKANLLTSCDMACERIYSQKVLGFSNVISSGNPTPYYDPIVSTSSPTLTSFGDIDFLLFEEPILFFAIEG
ncbi:reverse transcriptase domain-containing protein [Tanacetum coccineum]|uniref:Reverse transcriptase domain-containing protein n=1 Tax=Tanacetum coccineum TaxID=301880 RepID=A0ABQ5C0V4_9ASTR